MMLTDRECLILLNLVPNVGSARLKRVLDAFGSLKQILRADATDIQKISGISRELSHKIVIGLRDFKGLEEELKRSSKLGVSIVTQADSVYPDKLRDIPDPPLALYIKGTVTPEPMVAVVGSRRASISGMQAAEKIAYELAQRGISVISGLARGIDLRAHRGTLKAHGRTYGVLGSGLSHIYPPEHKELAQEVVNAGALISEYPFLMPPLAHNFPRRNRIISGLSCGVVVVEAAIRSGALITADCALEQGKDVYAIPGSIMTPHARGSNRLIQQGAKLVMSVEDILDELNIEEHLRIKESDTSSSVELNQDRGRVRLEKSEKRVVESLHNNSPRPIDVIAGISGLRVSEVSSLLLSLELKQLIKQLPGNQFVKCKQRK